MLSEDHLTELLDLVVCGSCNFYIGKDRASCGSNRTRDYHQFHDVNSALSTFNSSHEGLMAAKPFCKLGLRQAS